MIIKGMRFCESTVIWNTHLVMLSKNISNKYSPCHQKWNGLAQGGENCRKIAYKIACLGTLLLQGCKIGVMARYTTGPKSIVGLTGRGPIMLRLGLATGSRVGSLFSDCDIGLIGKGRINSRL